jgi:hypothetical protein
MNFLEYINNINIVKYEILLYIIPILLISLIAFIIVSFIIFKILQISIENNNIFFYKFNKKCQKILDNYGDYKISNIYITRSPISKAVIFAFDIITLFNFNKFVSISNEYYPYHISLLIEIKKDNSKKFLLLEKNNSINITENFLIHNGFELKKIKLNKKKITINKLLKITQDKIGYKNFFNWSITQNNCQEFTKNILETLGKFNNTNKLFIYNSKILDVYNPSEFTIHIINILTGILYIIEEYIYEYMF